VTREAYSHEVSSAGFWPGGDAYPQAAFYSYAYRRRPASRRRGSRPRGGLVGRDGRVAAALRGRKRSAADPDATLLRFLETTYRAAADLGGWDPVARVRARRAGPPRRSARMSRAGTVRVPIDRPRTAAARRGLLQARYRESLAAHQAGRLDVAEAGTGDPAAHAEELPRPAHARRAARPARRLGRGGALIAHAVAIDPSVAAAHANLGNARRLLGRGDEALASYERALRLQPDNTRR
jgi:tetratricopeptide (TPR) repeat protein